jgi:hypothetical protein
LKEPPQIINIYDLTCFQIEEKLKKKQKNKQTIADINKENYRKLIFILKKKEEEVYIFLRKFYVSFKIEKKENENNNKKEEELVFNLLQQ